MSTRWAVPVSLLPDELFSSWLTRAALAQGCDPLVLTGELWPRWRVWASDPDRGLSEERLSTLAGSSGIDVLKFEMATLRPIASAITSVSLDHLPIWPWVLALGSR
ncbi:MAG: TniQ family protein, partial [Aeromonas salmonicida]